MSDKCLNYAMHYIYRFPKTEKELRIQLLKKWFNDEEVDFAISNLKEKGYVDDKKFVQAYINSELSKKWKPQIVIKSKLITKWIDKGTIDEILYQEQENIENATSQTIKKEIEKFKRKWIDWFDIIQKLLSKWYTLKDIKKVV